MFGGKIRRRRDRRPLPGRDGSLGSFWESLSKAHTDLVFQTCLINSLLLMLLLQAVSLCWEVSSSLLSSTLLVPSVSQSPLLPSAPHVQGCGVHHTAWAGKVGGNKPSVESRVLKHAENSFTELKLHVFPFTPQEMWNGGLVCTEQAVASTPAPNSKGCFI